MDLWLQLPQWLVTGVTLGSIYALIALGFVTIYNVTGVINFAQGEFAMLGALLAVTLSKALPAVVAFVGAVLITAALGALMQRAALYPARGAPALTLIIITIGLSIAIRGAALIAWGSSPYALPTFTPGPPLDLGPAVLTRQSLWVLATTAALLTALWLFFERTMLGRALRACAVNPMAARLMGIAPPRMALLAFTLSAAVGAAGGVVIAPIISASYDMGLGLGLKGFVAAIMGGLTSPVGAVGGGLLLGALESVTAGALTSAYKDAVAFVVLLAVLLARRFGYLGGRGEERAGL